jgi:hypothetical protein
MWKQPSPITSTLIPKIIKLILIQFCNSRSVHNKNFVNYEYQTPHPNIVRVIKSRRMRWAGHVARMGEERGVYRFLEGKPEGKTGET